jgi:DNA-binding cell septation regulator SpoVG
MSGAPTIEVTEARFSAAPGRDRATGLMGWLSIVINNSIKIDGLTLRRNRDGRLYVGFPRRRGSEHYLVHPISDHARREVQHQILEAIAGEVAP